MGTPHDFAALQESVQKSLVSAVKTVNRISADDLAFQRTINPDVAQQLDDRTARTLELSTRLLQAAAKACGVKAPTLEDAEDVDLNWRAVVDVVDSVLEKADTALDEYTGLVKRKDPPTNSEPQTKRQKSTAKVIRNANISKPQTRFEVHPDNFPSGPWRPILTKKPHATESLKKSLVTITSESGALQYKSPYEAEISKSEYPSRIYENAEPISPQPVETTEATWVDTFEGVTEMLEELKKAKEIAVDLEHHDFRTYTGLVSLMQISTREKDWIVDTLQPWRHKLEVLNEVFADPGIIKVFHGAYMDMIWLQRDLGLYVNGLFDTYFACELLYSGRSLAFLLSKFVNFDADKQYQLADWRIRPLPQEMLYYARSDTHYLLYIYDRVRNDLVEASDRTKPDTDYIGRVLSRSKELSLSRHEHPNYDEESGEGSRGWSTYIFKHSHMNFSSEQFAVFRAIWKWRDATARKEDESPNFVLGTAPLAEIARINPPDVKALHSLIPQTAPLARSRLNEVWGGIQESKAQGGPSLAQFFSSVAPESVRHHGMPRISKAPVALPTVDGDVMASRLPRSHLFGDVPISSRWDAQGPASEEAENRIPFPWQRFVQTAPAEDIPMEDTNGTPINGNAVSQAPAATAVKAVKPEEEDDEEFTLKQGMKRKAEVVEEDSSSSAAESAPDNDEEMQEAGDGVISIVDDAPKQLSKKQRKKLQKAQQREEEQKRHEKKAVKATRKAEKKGKQQQAGQGKAKYNAVPFDYSQAASVLHADRTADAEGDAKTKKRNKEVFDPYSKSRDENVKGARKAPPVRGERSATFRK